MAPRRRGERPLRRRAPQIDELARFVTLCEGAVLHARANRELPGNNPSSSLYRLLEAIDPIEDQL